MHYSTFQALYLHVNFIIGHSPKSQDKYSGMDPPHVLEHDFTFCFWMNGPSHKLYPYATISHQQANHDHQIFTGESGFGCMGKDNFYFAKMTSSRGQI